MKPTNKGRSAVAAGLAAAALAVATTVTGCGTGQISQTADQVPAVDGAELTIDNLTLNNVRMQATQTEDFLQPGDTVELMLAASNQSPEINDRLLAISTDIGKVTLSPKTPELPVLGRLLIGTPAGQSTASRQENVTTAEATVTLSTPITNGIGYQFTFEFEKAGAATMTVPVSAGLEPQSVPTG